MSDIKLSIIKKTSEFRGDHAADVAIAYEEKPDETLQKLILRTAVNDEADVIEIRVIKVSNYKEDGDKE